MAGSAGSLKTADFYPRILVGHQGVREQLAGQLWQIPLVNITSSRFPLEQLEAIITTLLSDLSSWTANCCQGPKPKLILYHSATSLANKPSLPRLAAGQLVLDRGSSRFTSPNAAQLHYLPSLAAPTVASCAPAEQKVQLQPVSCGSECPSSFAA